MAKKGGIRDGLCTDCRLAPIHVHSTSYCKDCKIDREREWHRKQRRAAIESLGAKCNACGYDEAPEILEFDHIVPERRHSRRLFKGGGPPRWKQYRKDPSNFQLLCPNCHAKKTLADQIALWEQLRIERRNVGP